MLVQLLLAPSGAFTERVVGQGVKRDHLVTGSDADETRLLQVFAAETPSAFMAAEIDCRLAQ
jgi:hypothetical protein